LSSCDPGAEIFDVARGLTPGLVDVIAAGHTHDAVAHRVAGSTIVQAYSMGRAFGRADILVDREQRRVVSVTPFAPQDICLEFVSGTSRCATATTAQVARTPATYEGRPVADDPRVTEAMAPELARVRALQATMMNSGLERPIGRAGRWESPLGNLFADAMRDGTPGADAAINNNARGGLRADLPEGPLTFGRIYDVYPFDNRLVTLTLTGAELQQILSNELRRNRPNSIGVSGIRIVASCGSGELQVDLSRTSGQPVRPDERLTVVTMDMLAAGQFFAPAFSRPGFAAPPDAPVAREIVEDWLRGRSIDADRFIDASRPRWEVPATLACQ
jgi:5'-nucleotidase